jgi:hypothetical protein
MSLNRVASIETLADPLVRRDGEAHHRPRKLSFSPVPQDWVNPQPRPNKTILQPGADTPSHAQQPIEDTVSAFEVPEWKRIRKYSPALNTISNIVSYQMGRAE